MASTSFSTRRSKRVTWSRRAPTHTRSFPGGRRASSSALPAAQIPAATSSRSMKMEPPRCVQRSRGARDDALTEVVPGHPQPSLTVSSHLQRGRACSGVPEHWPRQVTRCPFHPCSDARRAPPPTPGVTETGLRWLSPPRSGGVRTLGQREVGASRLDLTVRPRWDIRDAMGP